MAFPDYTRTGKNWKNWFLEKELKEIEKEVKYNPDLEADWIPMFRELVDYVFLLEKRISELEDS